MKKPKGGCKFRSVLGQMQFWRFGWAAQAVGKRGKQTKFWNVPSAGNAPSVPILSRLWMKAEKANLCSMSTKDKSLTPVVKSDVYTTGHWLDLGGLYFFFAFLRRCHSSTEENIFLIFGSVKLNPLQLSLNSSFRLSCILSSLWLPLLCRYFFWSPLHTLNP